jgi:tRNA pseudouridine55 synthase
MNVVINLNKPENISSQKAVIKVKHLLQARKAGHAGTLDPMATGVLIVCLNEATKITRFLLDLDKEYIVTLKLGERTTTYDSDGKIIEKKECPVFTETEISDILSKFIGCIKQIPPMYSAKKINGQHLYKHARTGINIKRSEKTIHIYSIDLLNLNLPYLELKVTCSKGTYIRTLCDDIGRILDVGAHMVSLTRTRVGSFKIEESASLDDIGFNKNAFHSIDTTISFLDEVILDGDSYFRAMHGMPVYFDKEKLYKSNYIKLKDPRNVLFGIGKVEAKSITVERLITLSA